MKIFTAPSFEEENQKYNLIRMNKEIREHLELKALQGIEQQLKILNENIKNDKKNKTVN